MNSFIGWIGGKKVLRNEIIKRFPAEQAGRYIEVFGGAAWVLFGKNRHAKLEVYNDINGDLVNLFRCVKYHCSELQRELSFMLNSRELFYSFAKKYSIDGLTDIQRAARFFMLIKTSYGSDRRSYGCVKRDINVMTEYLTDIQRRLCNVVIENKDFENLIEVYDRSDALIYVDPPYYGAEKYYDVPFEEQDHRRLFNVLRKVKGKFILSYNNCAYVKELYKEFNIEKVERSNNLKSRYGAENYGEVLIKNY